MRQWRCGGPTGPPGVALQSQLLLLPGSDVLGGVEPAEVGQEAAWDLDLDLESWRCFATPHSQVLSEPWLAVEGAAQQLPGARRFFPFLDGGRSELRSVVWEVEMESAVSKAG